MDRPNVRSDSSTADSRFKSENGRVCRVNESVFDLAKVSDFLQFVQKLKSEKNSPEFVSIQLQSGENF